MVDIDSLDKLGPSGYTLNMEERSGLQVSMLQRCKEENYPSKLLFWGKIRGIQNDYLICYVLLPDWEFPKKKFYYCTTGEYTLKLLPEISEDYMEKAKVLNTRFKGDPSFPLEGDPEEEEDAENPVEKFREVHRLSYVCSLIDHDVAVVPRGALMLDAAHRPILNRTYEGLSYSAAGNLKSYYHFRKAESTFAKSSMEKEGLVRAGDFLDPIANDKPDGIWSLTMDPSNTTTCIRSFYWPGYFFYHTIATPEYGSVYFGDGRKNEDLAFMLPPV